MIFTFFKNRRRRRLLASPMPDHWQDIVKRNVRQWLHLGADDRAKMLDTARIIIAETEWVGDDGFEVTEEMKLTVAAQASLLLLGIEHDYFSNVKLIIISPEPYTIEEEEAAGPGGWTIVSETEVLGTAEHRGPVKLSWPDVLYGGRNPDDGRNLVLHEFAHKLDMLDDASDGTPPLKDRAQREAWFSIMTEHYENHRKMCERGRRTLFGEYAATHPVEFFAVLTELFFEIPHRLRREHPAIYDLFRDVYRQDPVHWSKR